MKSKIILAVMTTIILVVAAHALIYAPLKQAITAAGYVAVELPAGFGCQGFSMWTEDGASYYLASDAAGTNGILHPDGLPIYIGKQLSSSTSAQVLCYAKGTTSTNVVGHFIWK